MELDLEMQTESPDHSEKRSSSCLRYVESPVAFTVLSVAAKRADLDLVLGSKMDAVRGVACRRRNSPRPVD